MTIACNKLTIIRIPNYQLSYEIQPFLSCDLTEVNGNPQIL